MRLMDHRFSKRSREREWLDDLQLEGKALIKNLDEIASINRGLGGHKILVDGVRRAMALLELNQSAATAPREPTEYHIYDIGCGSGDGLRSIARWARSTTHSVKLIGQDANPHVIAHARVQSTSYPEIRYEVTDALKQNPDAPNHVTATREAAFNGQASTTVRRIAICSLFLHHLSDKQIRVWLKHQLKKKHAVVVSDLERSRLAHALFGALSGVARYSAMTKHDGLISIRRGFLRRELEQIAANSGARQFSLRWCWAFRYQMVLVA